jgi:hypothetical protein
MIQSWWGIGFKSFDNVVRGGIDTRTGNAQFGGILTAGVLRSNGLSVNNGVGNINAGNPFAVPNGYMSSGSLTIGDMNYNYGGGYNWTASTAGLLMECLSNTEIAIHDAGTRVVSFMQYVGDNTDVFYIGRDMGWGVTPTFFQGFAVFNGGFNSPTRNNWIDSKPSNNQSASLSAINSIDWIGLSAGSVSTGSGNSVYSNRVVIGTHNNAFGNGGCCIGAHTWNLGGRAILTVANPVNWYSSDQNIKENIITATNSLCYSNIKKIRIVRYNLKTDLEHTKELITKDRNLLGVLAQEYEQVFPKSTINMPCPMTEEEEKSGKEKQYIKSINTDQLQYTLVGCVQELQKKVETQANEVATLQATIDQQASQISQLIQHMTDLTNQLNALTQKINSK